MKEEGGILVGAAMGILGTYLECNVHLDLLIGSS